MSFTVASGIYTLGHAEMSRVTNGSAGDSANGRAPHVSLLTTAESCFQIHSHIATPLVSVPSGHEKCYVQKISRYLSGIA